LRAEVDTRNFRNQGSHRGESLGGILLAIGRFRGNSIEFLLQSRRTRIFELPHPGKSLCIEMAQIRLYRWMIYQQ
jgi:hypothetical protein